MRGICTCNINHLTESNLESVAQSFYREMLVSIVIRKSLGTVLYDKTNVSLQSAHLIFQYDIAL